MRDLEQKRKFVINTVFFIVIGVAAYVAVVYVIPMFFPFLLAFFFSAVIHMLVKLLPAKSAKGRKWLSLFLTGIFFIVVAFLVVILGNWTMRLLERAVLALPRLYAEEFMPWLYSLADRLESRYAVRNVPGGMNIGARVIELVQTTGTRMSEISVERVEHVSGYAKKIPSFMIKIMMTVVATFFLAADYERITVFLMRLLPKRGREHVLTVKNYMFEVLGAYVKSYSILMFLTFMELCIGLGILGVPYFPVIAFGIALFDILPVLGTGGILIPWAVVSVILGDYRLAVGIAILEVVIMVVRNILEPRIVGKQIGLHPFATLVALFVGLKIGGIVGMIGFPVCLSIAVQLGKEKMRG